MLKNLIDSLSSSDYIQFFASLFSTTVALFVGLLSIRVASKSNRMSLARERLDKVYQPLFREIEPLLYKKSIKYDEITSFLELYHDLENQYALLISPRLRLEITYLRPDYFPLTSYKYGYNSWNEVCFLVSHDYDRLCRHARLPIRGLRYRYAHRQFRSPIFLIFVGVWLWLPSILAVSLVLILLSPKLFEAAFAAFFAILAFAIVDEY